MFLLLTTLVALTVAQSFPGQQFQITSLPGLANFPTDYNVYGGYITVDASHGRALYFMFAEASDIDPSTAPIGFWQTGGPGCSSLLAQFTENGPFKIAGAGKLELNPYAWNKRLNMLWVESPAGVGFSYSNDTNDYRVGDARTAADANIFAQQFLHVYFPQYKKHPIYSLGESYGGHYTISFTYRALLNNAAGQPAVNVVGNMVGNAWTDAAFDNEGALDQWWTHALIDKASVDAVKANCNLSTIGPLTLSVADIQSGKYFGAQLPSASCQALVNHVQSVAFADVNIYDIYQDECNVKRKRSSMAKRSTIIPNPCTDNNLGPYLNDPNVQAAMNVIPGSQWNECSNVLSYEYSSVLSSMLPIYRTLMSKYPHIRLGVYSGDVDAIVPFMGTRAWVESLNLPIKKSWRSYYAADKFGAQVAGFVVEYFGLTFATVRMASHEAPESQPHRSLVLISSFVNGTWPTTQH
jgi:serine carboxypeptidase-like clade 2